MGLADILTGVGGAIGSFSPEYRQEMQRKKEHEDELAQRALDRTEQEKRDATMHGYRLDEAKAATDESLRHASGLTEQQQQNIIKILGPQKGMQMVQAILANPGNKAMLENAINTARLTSAPEAATTADAAQTSGNKYNTGVNEGRMPFASDIGRGGAMADINTNLAREATDFNKASEASALAPGIAANAQAGQAASTAEQIYNAARVKQLDPRQAAAAANAGNAATAARGNFVSTAYAPENLKPTTYGIGEETVSVNPYQAQVQKDTGMPSPATTALQNYIYGTRAEDAAARNELLKQKNEALNKKLGITTAQPAADF